MHRPTLPTSAVTLAAAVAFLALAGAATAQSGASATFEDKAVGGTTLTVDEATLPNGGFVAIHDATIQQGKVLKSVVGASTHLSGGTHENVTVHLDQPITEDQPLVAMPHKDTDGDRIYSFVDSRGSADGPYTKGGDPVTDTAQLTASATVTFDDQPSDGRTVVVDRVEMARGGFVAIHNDLLLEGMPIASVIGNSTFLPAGIHENVRVTLDEEITENQTIIAMPHEDSNDDESYDFVTSGGQEDGPYTDENGDAVVDPGSVTLPRNATVTFEDQSSGGTHLRVASTFLPEGGFVAFHDSTLLDGDVLASVRGTTACLEPGYHPEIGGNLDDPLQDDDTIIAMPHKDTNDNCTYDFVTSDGGEDGPYTKDGSAVTDDGDVVVSASVQAHHQDSDGRTITVHGVDMANGGFVAVHDPSLLAGDVLDSVVGHSSFLQAGHHDHVSIVLDEPVRTSQNLVPMPHKDTNGNQAYDFVASGGTDDGPYTYEGGAVTDVGYTIVQSQVTIEDQSTMNANVTVASATLHDGGFVTLHDDRLQQGKALESVVGVSKKLGPGTHTDVTVTLDDPPSGDATMIAMPHKDTNANGAYDFVTSSGAKDGPYVASGGPVIHSATVTFSGSGADGGSDGGTDGGTDGGDGGFMGAPGPGLAALAAAGAAAALVAARRP